MSRLLFLAAIVVVVYFLLKSFRSRPSSSGGSAAGASQGRAEDMVRCIYCGVHLPKSESILAGGNYYCCEAHRQAHRAAADRDRG